MFAQPPSGGCVLKQPLQNADGRSGKPAAFRRLCVETAASGREACRASPAAFRRLCVETDMAEVGASGCDPAAFRRLCVETKRMVFCWPPKWTQPPSGGCVLKHFLKCRDFFGCASRLQAAVC